MISFPFLNLLKDAILSREVNSGTDRLLVLKLRSLIISSSIFWSNLLSKNFRKLNLSSWDKECIETVESKQDGEAIDGLYTAITSLFLGI